MILLAVLGCLLYAFFSPAFQKINPVAFASPLTQSFSLTTNNQVTTLNTWQPSEQVLAANIENPDLSGTSYLSYDLTTNQVLLAKNQDNKMPMASLTKVMTAIVALEHPKQDDKYLVYKADLVGEDSMGLDANEVLSLKELLYGLILHSGNDAAETIASNYTGGRNAFVKAMNDKAKSLGLSNTNFTNPSGLQGDGNQYTTAQDLLIMTKYALQFPEFAEVADTVSITIPRTSTHKEYDLENETNLLTTYPGVRGIKTGYTDEAGLCLITYLQYGGHDILAILLNSQNRRSDMINILDYSLKSLGITPPSHG